MNLSIAEFNDSFGSLNIIARSLAFNSSTTPLNLSFPLFVELGYCYSSHRFFKTRPIVQSDLFLRLISFCCVYNFDYNLLLVLINSKQLSYVFDIYVFDFFMYSSFAVFPFLVLIREVAGNSKAVSTV